MALKLFLIMLLFATIFSLIFFCVSHNIFLNLINPFLANIYIKVILYIILFFMGQSFWLLIIDRDINKVVATFIYFIICISIFMFFYVVIVNVVGLFYKQLNMPLYTGIFLVLSVLLTFMGFFNRYNIRTTKYNLKTEKNVNMKIAFISDLHMGDLGLNKKILVKTIDVINKENPDFIIIGGDIIEHGSDNFVNGGFDKILKNAKAKNGVFAVLGNHDYYYKNPNDVVKTLENDGNIKVLRDNYLKFDNLILVGREDFVYRGRKSLDLILSNVDKNNFILLIDHNPSRFNESVKNNVDLQLSGHTHNGQFFPFNLIVKFFYEKAYGLLKKEKSTLIISSGLNTWGPPIKLGSKAEIVLVEINK